MKIGKKKIATLGLILALACTTIAFAILYVQKTLTFHGNIGAYGSIKIVNTETGSEITDLDFGTFDLFEADKQANFTIVNNGNVPVKINWNSSTPNCEHIENFAYRNTHFVFALYSGPEMIVAQRIFTNTTYTIAYQGNLTVWINAVVFDFTPVDFDFNAIFYASSI